MNTFPENFNDALARIEISGSRRKFAVAAHKEIREVLLESQVLKDWGLEAILIGSYARDTGIYPGKDVDVFGKLTKLDVNMAPRKVYDAFLAVLNNKYGDRADPQNRSIKVKFDFDGEKFSVDSVPAVRLKNRWAIPSQDPALWDREWQTRGWCETDPEKLTELTHRRNDNPKVGDRGAYVPTVKLIRQIRSHNLRDLDPGGLYFEMMAYWAFTKGVKGDNFAEILGNTLGAISQQLSRNSSEPLIDPVLERPYEPTPKRADIERATATFSDLAMKAERALSEETCPAAAIWRNLIGKNDRGWCFPLPAGCDETGKKITPIISAGSRGPSESHGFG
jgi:hypothetical protein